MATAAQAPSISKNDLIALAKTRGLPAQYVDEAVKGQGVKYSDIHAMLTALPDQSAKVPAAKIPAVAAVRPAVFATPAEEIAWYRTENERLKAKASGIGNKLTLKVSEKGALSVYGMGRFPVTLYREQWERLITNVAVIQDFIKANADTLTTKNG